MKDQDDKIDEELEVNSKPQSIGRRSLLKGTAIALPAILTLQSGAALARSSNLIRTSRSKKTDSEGRTLCLDLQSVRPVGGRYGDTYDMGPNPRVDVYRIPERDYFVKRRNGRWREIDETALCERRGVRRGLTVAYKDAGRVHQVKLPKLRHGGGIVSATALASVAHNVVYYDL